MQLNSKRKRNVPELNTSALPDLIFTVLFFFMIVTYMRQTDVNMNVAIPSGNELQKLQKRYAVTYLYIGYDTDGTILMQLDKEATDITSLANALQKKRSRLPDDEKQYLTVSVKADKKIPAKMIGDVKAVLRKVNVLRISYTATEIIKKP